MTPKFLLVLVAKTTDPMRRMLDALLRDAGIPPEHCDTVYVLGDEQPEGAHETVLKSQYARTRPAFRAAMEAREAAVVIPIGPEAFQSVTGLTWKIDEARGYVFLPEDCRPAAEAYQIEEGVYKSGPRKGQPKMKWVSAAAPPPLPRFTTDRPAIVPVISLKQYVKQKRRQVTAVIAPLETAARYASGEAQLEQVAYNVELPESLSPPNHVSFDVEVPMGSAAIDRFSMSWTGVDGEDRRTYTYPWGAKEKELLALALQGRKGYAVAHNIQFDVPILYKNGVPVPEPWWDTMICASLLEPDLPKGLGPTAPLYLTLRPWKYMSRDRGFADPEYSATDAHVELRLFEEQQAALEEWGMTELFTERIMPSVPALMDLKEAGLRVHRRETEDWCAGMQAELTDLFQWWDERFPGVSSTSNKDLTNLLYKTWGLPVQRSNHDGWTVDRRALHALISMEPKYEEPLRHLLKIRKVTKLLGTYGKALIGNDRVHPGYLPRGKDFDDEDPNQGLPGTGRLASSGPNIQNQPDSSRRLYLPDDDDWVWVAADYSQAEAWVMAVRSGDTALIEALKSGLHEKTMAMIPGTTKVLAKNGFYGSSFGAGPKRLVEMLQMHEVYTTTKAMKDFQGALARIYPRWWAYLQSVGELGVRQGFLRNPFGRVRRFTAGNADVPAMKDYESQSTVGEIGWSTYRDLWDAANSIGCRLSILLHDEVVLQGPKDKVEEMNALLHDIMEREFDEVAPGFSIPIKVKVGARWGKSMVPYEETREWWRKA